MTEMQESSSADYSAMLKSSAILGLAQLVTAIASLVRAKSAAIFLGTAGLGVLGNLQTLQLLQTTIAGLGISTSTVRAVAHAKARPDAQELPRLITSVRRIAWILATLGGVSLALAAGWVSEATFGTRDYAPQIVTLGASVFLSIVAGLESALLQGTHHVWGLAKSQAISGVVGCSLAVGLFAGGGTSMIGTAIGGASLLTALVTWSYSRKIARSAVAVSWRETAKTSLKLFRFGVAVLFAALCANAGAYVIRMLLTRQQGLDAVGLYTAAFSLSALLTQFVITAMGTDFYPRLTMAADDRAELIRLVNQQTEIGILLGLPLIIATLALAPFVLALLYSKDFVAATPLIKWFLAGCLAKFISWPMGFILLARARSGLYVFLESLFLCLQLTLTWMGISTYGVEGAAIAYALTQGILIPVLFSVNRIMIGFCWTGKNIRNFIWVAALVLVSVAFVHLFDSSGQPSSQVLMIAFGSLWSALVASLCAKQLLMEAGMAGMPRSLRRLASLWRANTG